MSLIPVFKFKNHSVLLTNIFSLGTIQLVNYILPLLTVPYLVRILKPEYFGLIAFSTATITYFVMLTDYGFNLSATRQISIHRKNLKKINEIFNSTILIQAALLFISFIILNTLILTFEIFSKNWELYYISFGMVVGHFLFPVWLFQGLEKMKYITIINVITKITLTLLVFIVVKKQEDYLLVPILTSSSFIVSGIFSLIIAKYYFKISFFLPKKEMVLSQLKKGWFFFSSNLSVSLFTTSTTFILGVFTTNQSVGLFAAADKIITAIKGLNSPISQSIYPIVSKKIVENKREGISFILKSGKIIIFFNLIFSILLFILSEPICDYILGDDYQESIHLLRIMSFLPLIIVTSNICAVQGLYNLGKAYLVSRYLIIIGISHLVLIFLLIPPFGVYGAATSVVITEIFGTLFSIYYFKKEIKLVI
jgi:PST family polysaccharide transporter